MVLRLLRKFKIVIKLEIEGDLAEPSCLGINY